LSEAASIRPDPSFDCERFGPGPERTGIERIWGTIRGRGGSRRAPSGRSVPRLTGIGGRDA